MSVWQSDVLAAPVPCLPPPAACGGNQSQRQPASPSVSPMPRTCLSHEAPGDGAVGEVLGGALQVCLAAAGKVQGKRNGRQQVSASTSVPSQVPPAVCCQRQVHAAAPLRAHSCPHCHRAINIHLPMAECPCICTTPRAPSFCPTLPPALKHATPSSPYPHHIISFRSGYMRIHVQYASLSHSACPNPPQRCALTLMAASCSSSIASSMSCSCGI